MAQSTAMIHALSEIAFKAEETAGTIVAADKGLVVDEGLAAYEEVIERQVREAPRGVLTEVEDILTRKQSNLTYTQDLTYEEFPIVLLGGLKKVAGATDNGAPYTYTVLPSMTAPDALDGFSFEVFGTSGATQHFKRKFGHGQCSEFSVSGSFGDAAKLNATWFGRAGQDLASPASPAVLTRTMIPTELFTLSIDDSWANLGNTAKSTLLRDFNVTINTGVQPDYVVAGRSDLDFAQIRRGMITGSFELTAEFDTAAATEVAAWRDGTMRFMRLKATVGATSTLRELTLDGAVKYVEAPVISEADGLVTVTLNGRLRFDPTSSNVFQSVVKNAVASY